MKKSIALLFAGLVAGAAVAGMNNVVITFTTGANDAYADGTPVENGETYALVWTPDEETFAGFNLADGTAIAPSKIAIKASVGKPGVSQYIKCEIDETKANADYPNGTWGVYLLDTRVFETEEVTVEVDGEEIVQEQVKLDAAGNKKVRSVGGPVKGYGALATDISRSMGSATADGAVKTDEVAAGLSAPTIEDFKVCDGYAYITLGGTKAGVPYNYAMGQNLKGLKPSSEGPVIGSSTGTTVIVAPANDHFDFYTGVIDLK